MGVSRRNFPRKSAPSGAHIFRALPVLQINAGSVRLIAERQCAFIRLPENHSGEIILFNKVQEFFVIFCQYQGFKIKLQVKRRLLRQISLKTFLQNLLSPALLRQKLQALQGERRIEILVLSPGHGNQRFT